MADKIGGIAVTVSADVTNFTKGMDTVHRETGQANKSLASFGKAAAGAALSITKWATAASLAAVATSAAIYKSTLTSIRDLRAQAQAAGLAVTELERGAFAAKQFGIEQDKYADILKDVNDRLGDFAATGAGTMIDFFENIAPKVGVTAEAFKGLSSEQALGLYVKSLEDAGVAQEDMTFYMEAIGSDATRLIPLFENNAKKMRELQKAAEDLGVGMSEIEVEQAIAAQTELDKLALVFDSKIKTAVANLSPIITEMLSTLTESLKSMASNGELSFTSMLEYAKGFGIGVAKVADAFKYLHIAVKTIELAITGLGSVFAGMSKLFWNQIEFLTTAVYDLGRPFAGVADMAVNAFDSIGLSILRLIKDYIQPFINQMSELPYVGEMFEGISSGIDSMAASLNNANPSKLRDEYSAFADSAINDISRIAKNADGMYADALAESTKTYGELQALLSEPMPSENVEAFFNNIIQKATEARAKIEANIAAGATKKDEEEEDPTKKVETDPVTAYQMETVGLMEAMGLRFESQNEMLLAQNARELEILEQQKRDKLISEEEYQKRAAELTRAGEETKRQILVDNLQQGFQALTQNSKKASKVMEAVAIYQAGIKGAQSAVDAFQAGMSTGGPFAPVVAAAYTAASLARTGALINNIRGGGKSSGGGGAAPSVPQSAQQAGGGGSSSQQSSPQRIFNVNMTGQSQSTQSVRDLLGMINEEIGNGLQIRMG
jgi:hypothetical protein